MDEVHAQFIASRMSTLSKQHLDGVILFTNEHSIPRWSGSKFLKEEGKISYASNVSVTFNDFYNMPHEDNDVNGWTYGLFSYIDPQNGQVRLPPSTQEGHRFQFPKLNCSIDFAKAEGIIELLWKSNKDTHQTTKPPEELRTTSEVTHFGCSWKINQWFAINCKKLATEVVLQKTSLREVKYPNVVL